MHPEITATLVAETDARRRREAELARLAALARHPAGRGRRLSSSALLRRLSGAPADRRTPGALARAKP